MKIENRPLAEIKPYERNPRRNAAAVDAMAKVVSEMGDSLNVAGTF